MKAADIEASLRKTYCQPEWALFTEVTDGTGSAARRRADAVAMNMWPSRGLELRAFEIKVSRSDLISEIKDPSKAEAFAQFCNTFFLVTPKGLSKGIDVPHTWGIIEINDGGQSKIVRQSDLNKTPTPMTKNFIAGLIRAASKVDEDQIKSMVMTATEQIRQAANERTKREIERALSSRRGAASNNEELLSLLTDILGKDAGRLINDRDFIYAVTAVHGLGLATEWKGVGKLYRDLADICSKSALLAAQLGGHMKNLKCKEPDQ